MCFTAFYHILLGGVCFVGNSVQSHEKDVPRVRIELTTFRFLCSHFGL